MASLIKRARPRAEVGHDYPHAGELLKGDMHKVNLYIGMIQEIIRQIYAHFSKSPKRLRGLEAIAVEFGVTLAQLHYVFEVRMVESEVIAIRNFLKDLPTIIKYLEAQVAAAKAAGKVSVTTIKQQGWIRQIKQLSL